MSKTMNQRENYQAFCWREPGARVPNMDHGALEEAIARWWREGMSPDLDPHRFDEWCDIFGLDRYYYCIGVGKARHRPAPCKEEVLEETEHTITKRHGDGSIRQEGKAGTHQSIPHELHNLWNAPQAQSRTSGPPRAAPGADRPF